MMINGAAEAASARCRSVVQTAAPELTRPASEPSAGTAIAGNLSYPRWSGGTVLICRLLLSSG